ncbi:hypothetical protein [Allokutzneria oryzae]|uniref:Secreted protein n=1 Tax=Allokutzneria oryzae TaxID=1378989 RepID=A0ABV5ZU47_9PSEU
MISVRLNAVLAAAAALAASTALVLPGQAAAATGELVQQRQNLDCGFTPSYVARDRGWPNAAHYKHCSHDGRSVYLKLHNNIKDGYFCSPAHQDHEASQLPLIDGFYEAMHAEVIGFGCAVG